MMTNDLPISINASDVLTTKFIKLVSTLIKHEAHFNFHTLAAGWYENENSILEIEFLVVSLEEFTKHTIIDNQGDSTEIADDVLSYFDPQKNKVMCFVAITESESALLQQEQKLLTSYTKAKLMKALNCIAVMHQKVEI